MFDEILFPTDGSEGASAVFEHVLDLAAANDATVHLLNVADTTKPSTSRVGGEVVDVLVREGEGIVEDAAGRARERGVDVVTEVRQGRPYEHVLDYADRYDVDLLVMPTHGRSGLQRLLLGSVTERVLRRSPVPVLAVRPDDECRYPYENVLVPTDGSATANEALSTGIGLAEASGAALHLLSVVDVTSLGVDAYSGLEVDALEEGANEVIEEATAVAENADLASVSATVEYGSSIHGEILGYVDEHDVDLVVVGTHGRTGFDRFLLGSVTEKLVRTSPVPVLTVRAPGEPADGE